MIRFGTFLTAFLFITISSCKSSKAADFKESINKSQLRASYITLQKDGLGEKKMKCLQKDDYKGALMAVDEQAIAFDMLIADITKLSTDGIPKGELLKTAAVEYYKSLKELHVFDRKQIQQQALLPKLNNNELNNAQSKLIALARQKKMLYDALYDNEAIFHSASESFEAANDF